MLKTNVMRTNNRAHNQLRPMSLSYNAFGYAPGSVLFTLGNTKVLCSVNLQPNVPHFLKGSKSGWLAAEYAMLPAATHMRTSREVSSVKRNGRSVEISRLIGRSLRTIIDLEKLGERTIIIDCDVLQADGSTRTACITAANYALHAAQTHWIERKVIGEPIITNRVAAVSVGLTENTALLDLDYTEDSTINADFNVVLTASGQIVEMQGAAEKSVVSWEQFDKIKELAILGVQELFASCDAQIKGQQPAQSSKKNKSNHAHKAAIFSLKNR